MLLISFTHALVHVEWIFYSLYSFADVVVGDMRVLGFLVCMYSSSPVCVRLYGSYKCLWLKIRTHGIV